MIKLSLRLKTIFSLLDRAAVFADIGCDHGYIAYAMLESGKCEKAIVTDVSAACLKKAEDLLAEDFAGRYEAIVADGFRGVPRADEALIAGMGGELIAKIIEEADYLPAVLVVQPMKNPEKARLALLKAGYRITRDYTFEDGKFYELIRAERGEDEYTERELVFGRDNLKEKGEAFVKAINKKKKKLVGAINSMNDAEREKTLAEISVLEEIIK